MPQIIDFIFISLIAIAFWTLGHWYVCLVGLGLGVGAYLAGYRALGLSIGIPSGALLVLVLVVMWLFSHMTP
jgi:hypothetical protein